MRGPRGRARRLKRTADREEVTREVFGATSTSVCQTFPHNFLMVGEPGIGDEGEEVIGNGMLEQSREVVIAEQNRNRSRTNTAPKMCEAVLTDLRGILDFDEMMNQVNVRYQKLIGGRKHVPMRGAFNDLLLSKMQHFDVIMILCCALERFTY